MRVGLADPVHDWVPVCGVLGGGGTAGHEQHIRAGHIGEGRVDAQVQQVVLVVDYTRVLGADDALRVVQIGEHLIGADRVQGCESSIKADGDDHEILLLVKWSRGLPLKSWRLFYAAAGWPAASLSYWIGDINAAELCRRRVL